MTQVFGIPTSDNPRPYGCPECDTAFRKHGHLAKHLRSKSHITKLESNGLIPIGTYAALEKCGQDLKDKLVTTNCEQSLQSLRQIAMHLFNQQPMPDESLGQTADHTGSLANESLGYPQTSHHQSTAPDAPPFASGSSPPPLHLHPQTTPLSPPSVTMPSSNMMMSQSSLPPASVSQNLHGMHPAHDTGALGMADNRTSQLMMMNMVPHMGPAQSLDYTLPPPTVTPELATKAPMMGDPYSHLGIDLESKQRYNPHPYQQQPPPLPPHHHHHHHQQHLHLPHQHQHAHPHPHPHPHPHQHPHQQHLHHQQPTMPATTYAAYSHVEGQHMPISMAPAMGMGPSCPTTGSSYMRH